MDAHGTLNVWVRPAVQGRAPARSGVARPMNIEKANISRTVRGIVGQKRKLGRDVQRRIAQERVPTARFGMASPVVAQEYASRIAVSSAFADGDHQTHVQTPTRRHASQGRRRED